MVGIDFKNISVLLIEDDALMSEFINLILHDLNIGKVVTAQNGQEALVKLRLREIEPDVILCDLEMPVMDGFEFLATIRGEQGLDTSDTPVLVLTGHKDEESTRKAIKLGIHGYLAKPVKQEDILKRITHALTSPMIQSS